MRLSVLLALLASLGLGCGSYSVGPGSDAGTDPVESGDDVLADAPIDVPMEVPLDLPTDVVPDAPFVRGHDTYVPPGLQPTAAARLVLMGDSITAGTGASRAALTYGALLHANDDATYPADTATDLTSLFGALQLVDVSFGGARTGDLARQVTTLFGRLANPVAGHSIIVMTIGGNDLQAALLGTDPTGAPLTTAARNITNAVTSLQDGTRFPEGTSIYIADVYDPSDGVGYIRGCFFNLTLPDLVAALPVWRDRYVSTGMTMGFAVVDMLGHFRGHGFYYNDPANAYYDATDPTGWFADCVHPNNRGHHEIRRLFFEAIDGTYVVP